MTEARTLTAVTGTAVQEGEGPIHFPELVGNAAAFARVRQELGRAVAAPFPVLVTGESGTGKELVASMLHRYGPRAGGPSVSLNCAALPDALLESALFGYRRGAFTGADRDCSGLFQAARGGTLFLDEVHQLSLLAQAKLLRAVDTGEILPLGSTRAERSDARVVAASNVDLEERVAAGSFRHDLYYRLHVLTVRLPSLREVPTDIPALADHFLAKICARLGTAPPALSAEAAAALVAAPWPGNVRQLIHQLERSVLLCREGVLRVEHLSEPLRRLVPDEGRFVEMRDRVADAWERDQICRGLQRTGWNVSRLARELGLSRRGLIGKMSRYGLRRAEKV